ncbi:MAG: phosphatidate cytidylyltransferase [Rhodospirillales bacterium]|jgi:phosphatidate cytidylyltransferase|nr:phosphatidate cytidylyltransferase [Rhodospirillales bacterium]
MAETVDSAHPLVRDNTPARGKSGSLRLRVASAVVLAPVALAAAWLGPPLLSLLVVCAAAGMAWEWTRLCRGGRSHKSDWLVIFLVVASVVTAAFGAPAAGVAVGVLGSAVAATLNRDVAMLAAGGVLWISLPCIALLWLAADPGVGRPTVLWILGLVWATDIGAYAVGRALGGPRLAPRFSPNKTWAGLAGGVVCAAAAGAVTALLLGNSAMGAVVLLSGALAVVAQAGDLVESVAKRRFGVKDSSGLIPGHGGLLDRLDGMLAVVPAVALLSILGGSGVLTWQ